MIVLDVFCTVVILFFLIRGVIRGLLNTLFWLSGIVCAGFIAFHLFRPAGTMLAGWIGLGASLLGLVAFCVIFFMITGIFMFVGRMTTAAAGKLHLSVVNRLLGAGGGTAIGILVSGTVVYAIRAVLNQAGQVALLDRTLVARPAMDVAVAILGAFSG
jgi:membrane protein required for colicin V production